MSDLIQKLQANMHMPIHLENLERLLKRKIQKNDLLTVKETEEIRQRELKNSSNYPMKKFEISFEDRRGPKFKKFIESLAKANPLGVYVWLPNSRDCGLAKPVPLLDINFTFEFDWIKEGIFSVATSDGENSMILDFSEEDGEQVLEVEVQGRDWSSIPY